MSNPSRQLKSGLLSVKRDFSSKSATPSLTQDSMTSSTDLSAIPWTPAPTPTPPSQRRDTDAKLRRLKMIQDGLDQGALEKSSSSTQRPHAATQPAPETKKRQLPPGWDDSEIPAARERNLTQPLKRTRTPDSLGASGRAATATTSKSGGVFLSEEQKHILRLVEAGKSVFYTGSAGTGKSVLLREIITALRARFRAASDAVAVTASTGIAACNIGGVTIHSFAGIGIGEGTVQHLVDKIRKNKKASSRWARTRVLIIDEVSMVDGDLFDKLARIGSMLRKNSEPFGGIQVIVTGDFFQLPPVFKGAGQVKFAFEGDHWSQAIQHTFNLTKVFRQRDTEFVDMLNEMRFGNLTPASISRFRSLSREIVYEDGLGATELFPRREDVERSNSTRISGINSKEIVFKAFDGGMIQDPTQRAKMLENFMAPRELKLKLGAQVMLIKNIDETMVNGSMGKIIEFRDANSWKNGGGDELSDLQGKNTSAGGKAPQSAGGPLFPVVEFLQPRGPPRRVLVEPEVFKVELPNGEVQVSRAQLPLILAWAMSIHKSQGQTLERVKVDLAKVFEKGQAYVALSRATSLDGLQVLNFDPRKVQAHPKVIQWSKTLQTVSYNH